jgi:hypothetical protein
MASHILSFSSLIVPVLLPERNLRLFAIKKFLYLTFLFAFQMAESQSVQAPVSAYKLDGRIVVAGSQPAAGVPYATILSLSDASIGGIANEQGEFSIWLKPQGQETLEVRALGFTPKLVTIEAGQQSDVPILVEMTTEPVVLPEVFVQSATLKKIIYGSKNTVDKNRYTHAAKATANQAGAAIGNTIFVRNTKGYLDSLSFFFAVDPAPASYILSVFGLQRKNIEPYRLYPIADLIPLMQRPIAIQIKGSGWQGIRLAENIFFENMTYLVLAIVKQTEFKKAPDSNMFEYDLVHQQSDFAGELRQFYIFGNRYAIMAKKDGPLAMTAHLLIE